MDAFNMQTKTILKTNQLYPRSIAPLLNSKRPLIFISSAQTIHIYNILENSFLNQVKPQKQDFSGCVTCLTSSDQLIFFASGMKIGAVAMNGRVVFSFDTYLAAQKIDSIEVSGYRLWVFTGNMVNEFLMAGNQLINKMSRSKPNTASKTQDVHSHVFDAEVSYSTFIENENQKQFLLLLKNNNQIITYDHKQTLASLKTNSPPICSFKYPAKHNQYLVGTMGGQILCIEVERKSIKKKWQVEGTGKINCFLQMKNNCWMVFRDEKMEIWNMEREKLASEETEEKIVCGYYLADQQLLIAGSYNGRILQICDYDKMIKEYRKKNQTKERELLIKEIQVMKKEKQVLEERVQKYSKLTGKLIKADQNVVLDYNNFCYALEIQSSSYINKIMVKGPVELISKQYLTFEGVEKSANKQTINSYILEYEKGKNFKILFHFRQDYHEDCKLNTIIFAENQSKIYAITNVIQLKPMSFHHKIAEPKIGPFNLLKVSGDFKYFEMNLWLNSIFTNFGSSAENGTVFQTVCYQSLLTKQNIRIRYRNNQCQIECENPYSLLIIKKIMIEKSKQKHKSLNYTVETSNDSIRDFIEQIGEKIKKLQELKKQNDLLPGLLEMSNEPNLSADLKEVLSKGEKIQEQFKQKERQYNQLKNEVKKCYEGYRKLMEKSVSEFQIDFLNREMKNFESEAILQRFFQ